MSKAISIDKIIESTLDGIDESMNVYQEWSGGEWLWNAPEYLITIKIAENIASIEGSKYITLEDNVDYVLDLARAKGQGKVSGKARTNGRSDIVLWWANGTPRAIVEVKNSVFRLDKIAHDIDRIREILKRKKSKSTLQFGLISFYIDRGYKTGNAKENVESKIYKIFDEIKEKYSDMTCKLAFREKEIYKDDTDAWSSVVFLLRVK
ncbi:MAG: hypothetical protein DRQ78_06980 [Epsilonproteobacteria bacterium]|nr:MAG: hypothetical protein DRQ78_06980 [Campylobacterota bacterium]